MGDDLEVAQVPDDESPAVIDESQSGPAFV